MDHVRRHRPRRILPVLLATALVPAALAGCSSTPLGAGGGAPASGEAATVGLAGSFLTNPFQVVLVDGIGTDAEKIGLNLLPATNADADPAQQITDIQNLLSQNVNGLIVVPVDSSAVIPGIEQANNQSIPVVTVDVAPNGGDVYMVVRADNYYMGQAACEAMGEAIGGAGTVLNLQGDLASVNGLDRSDGFTDCMTQKFPDVEVISRPTNWVAQEATDAAQAVASTTDLAGIFMASDTVMGPSIAQVLQTQGKWTTSDDPNHIFLAAIDGGSDALQFVRDGYFDAVVSQPADLYSKYSTQYIKDAIDGKTYEEGPTDHDSEIVRDENGILEDLLPSPVVTKDNVDDPALWGNSQN